MLFRSYLDVYEGIARNRGQISATAGGVIGEANRQANRAKIFYGLPREPDLSGFIMDEDSEDEVRQMDGDDIDLDGPIRDAIILNLPLNPLCKPDCIGLCPNCGEKLENLPKDHAHEKVDARWAALSDLKERLASENKREK